MSTEQLYKTEPLKCWQKAKDLRTKYYQDYATAHERGALRYLGGAWNFDAIPKGLKTEVHSLTGEPYGASCAANTAFSARALEKAQSYGFAKDICAYCGNYLGSVLLDEYVFGGPVPKPNFIWQSHLCCTHSKWYVNVNELEGGLPMYSVDLAAGAMPPFEKLTPAKIEYLAGQLLDGIDWLTKVTGQEFDDEKFIQAVKYSQNSMYKWSRACELNQHIPAPLGERQMFSLYVLGTLDKASKEVSDFYDELCDEVEDRAKRGIAAIPNEKHRLMTDSQPPWAFLEMWTYLEKEFNTVSIGSLYTFSLEGSWEVNQDGRLVPKVPIDPGTTRESACRALAEYELYKPVYQSFYHSDYKSRLMIMLARQWKVDGVILHMNRGCEGSSIGVPENRLALMKEGFPCLMIEGSMADERSIDKPGTYKRIQVFMEQITGKKSG
ncbi:MAG: benzoyl-CoA reductase, bzd-type, subunit O [Chloroflexi bacterium]|nr:benzoyl-CoA reductase, bzd-type, subunit O [Chloroflexota bacterium]